jgi:ATP-dependent Clp protease ATP-binding subunit ClpA
MMDDGRLTDGQGRTVDFKNTLIIMTSNIGSPIIQEFYTSGNETGTAKDYARVEELVRAELKQHFRPEFLNRVDDIIIFHSLDEKQLAKIVEIQLRRLRERLAGQQLSLDIDAAARRYLAK